MNLGPHLESIGIAVGVAVFILAGVLVMLSAEDNRNERAARRRVTRPRPAPPAVTSNVHLREDLPA